MNKYNKNQSLKRLFDTLDWTKDIIFKTLVGWIALLHIPRDTHIAKGCQDWWDQPGEPENSRKNISIQIFAVKYLWVAIQFRLLKHSERCEPTITPFLASLRLGKKGLVSEKNKYLKINIYYTPRAIAYWFRNTEDSLA